MRHAWVAFVLVGCGSSDAIPPPDVALSVGKEKTAWTDTPQAARLHVDLVQLTDGMHTPLVEKDAPPATEADDMTPPVFVQIPEQHFDRPEIASFEATGLDKEMHVVLRGDSIFYSMTSIYAVRVPIFMGRVQTWARPLSEFGSRHIRPVVDSVYELFIAAGGEPVMGQDLAVPEFFDAAVWQTVSPQPALPRVPKSMTAIGTKLIVIDDAGATYVDLANDDPKTDHADLSPPTPALDFSQVAGGEALEQPTSMQQPNSVRFIVGATRQDGAATDKVLRIDDMLKSTVFTLSTPRVGAAATFVGTTLIVAGGTTTGPMAEVLTDGANAFMPLAYPPDATAGLALAALDDKTVLLVGGKDAMTGAAAPLRTIDITCTASCTSVEVGTSPVALTRTRAFILGKSQILFVGETDENGVTGVDKAFSIDPSKPPPFVVDEKAPKEPRAMATAALLPNGQVGLVGGHLLDAAQTTATSLPIFIP
jgi:hypothetical protein